MATIIQLRRDNTVNWADADPILAEGEMGWEKSGNEITAYKIGDGVRKWSELPYGSNISILQELGDNETAVISQKAVTDEINKNRYMIYPSTGIMGSPIPDLNHVANYSSGGDFIAYNESTKYDCAWVNIYEGSKNLTITGATPSLIGYFSTLLPTPASLLGKGTTIPSGAKICLVNFLKSANTAGYGNLKITQEGMPAIREDSEVAKRDIKAVVSLSNCLADSFTATPVSINLLDTVNLLRNWGFQDGAVVNDPKFITSGKIYLKSMYYTVQGIRAYSTNLNLYIASFDFDGNYIGRTLIPLESASNLTKTFLYTKLAGAAYERIVLSSTGDLPSYANMQLEEGFTAHTPVAFQGWIFDESERDFVSQSRMRYSEYPVGKNYINESDLLYGYSLQNGKWIPLVRGVASNRLFLKDGTTYTVSNLSVFSPTITSMYLAYFDKDGNFLKRTAHAMVVDSTGLKGSCTFTANVDDGQTFYVRIVLQSSNVNVNYVPNPQLEVGSAATAYEAYAGTKYVLEVKGSKLSEEKNVLLTGASFAFPDNEWFRYVCDDLGITGYNKAVSGETMQHTAQKMHDGTLYTQAEFEDFDIFLIFHSHNQTVTDPSNLKENYEDYVFPLTDRSAQWDYVLKKYAAECYAARLNTNSRWYGTKDGKPYRVVVVTHWHDARTIFNNSIRELQAKWGFTLCELDKRIGFSKNEVHPVTGAQVSILHCDNPSNNTEIIGGVEYGWHPTRNKGAWIQHRMADIIGSTLITCEAPTEKVDLVSLHTLKRSGSFAQVPNVIKDCLYNVLSSTDSYWMKSYTYDCAIIEILQGSSTLNIQGINGTDNLLVWFSDLEMSVQNYLGSTNNLSTTIPTGAVCAVLDIKKVNVPSEGYKNFRVLQEGAGASKKEVNEIAVKVDDQEEVLRKQNLIDVSSISDTTGYFIGSTGAPIENAGFHYIRFDIDNSKSYKVSSAIGGNSTIRFVSYYKEDGTYLGYEYLITTPSGGSYELLDQPLHIPEGATYIYVNAALSRTASLKEVEYGDYYDLSVLDNEVSKLMKVHIYGLSTDNDTNLFYVRTSYNKTKDILILYKTNNNALISPKAAYIGDKTLSDSSLMSSTYSVSEHPDSTAPLFNSSVYWHLFAQHGYVIPYIANSNGMVTGDIGAIWKDQLDRQFVIGNVTSSSIYLLPIFDTSGGEGNITRSWQTPLQTAVNALTHVSGGTTTTAITGATQNHIQLRPIMKSYNRKMILDGKEVTEAGDYLCDEFQASESQIGYDPATVPQQNWFPTVGSIGVPNLEGALEMARFSWSYNFKGANCCVNTTIDIRRKVECQSYGACQQQFFLDKGNYKAMFLIPKLKPQSGIDPSKPFNSPSISSTGLSYQRNSTYLINENDLVDRQIGYLYDEVAGDYLVGMAAGLSLVSGDTVKEKRIQNISIGTGNVHERLGSFSPSNINKFYIAAVNTAPFADDGYNFPNTYFKEINYYVSYFDPTENVGQVYWYKDGSQYVIYAHCQTVQDRISLKLPYFMEGLGVEVVEKTNGATLLSSTIQNGNLYVSYDDNANYIVLKTI